MNGYKKEEVKRDMCRSHSARSERELFRVCPSKLSKKELEDLYFTLLEKNLELKKTVTSQQEQIKVLSTRVQRMTATQKNNAAKEKDCCMYSKAMVNEQKESIADLKRANEKMAERIRVLNMRLCSAKQFLRRCPATSTSRCTKCSAPAMSLKNSSVSVLHPKVNDSNIKTAVSIQGLDKDVLLSTRTVETETEEPEKENTERPCNENRCRSLMDELKQKIVNLQVELSRTHAEYSSRTGRLEAEVTSLRSANERERTQRATSDHQLALRAKQLDQLAVRLRDSEAKYGDLSTELSIEKRKVAELETRVKAADRASVVAKTLQERLSNTNQMKNEIECQPPSSPYLSPRWDKSSSPRLEVPCDPCETPIQQSEATDKPSGSKASPQSEAARLSKQSNDSGYIEAYKSPKVEEEKVIDENEELKDRISHLQQQMDQLLSAVKLGMSPPDPAGTGGARRQITKIPAYDEDPVRSKSHLNVPHLDTKSVQDDILTFLDSDSNADNEQKAATSQQLPVMPSDIAVAGDDAREIFENDKPERDSDLNKEAISMCSKVIEEPKLQTRRDSHNRLQIPGPMPVDSKYKIPDKIIDKSEKRSGVKRNQSVMGIQGANINDDDTFRNRDGMKTSDITPDDNMVNESIIKVKLSQDRVDAETSKEPVGSLMEKYVGSDIDKVATPSTIIPVNPEEDIETDSKIELCLHHTRVCTCTGKRRRDVCVFRTCSGTLRFRTEPAAPAAPAAPAHGISTPVMGADKGIVFKKCPCNPHGEGRDDGRYCDQATQVPSVPEATEEFRQRSATYSKGQTYPIPPHTPDNTDCEISSLTDLPSEKDDKSPRAALSPGEQKPTTTYTGSYTPHTTTEYSSLSEGELPGAGGAQKLSDGEAQVDDKDKKLSTFNSSQPRPPARLEETLTAISQELARCRELLHARRTTGDEHDHRSKRSLQDASLMTDTCPTRTPIALKRATATPCIGDAFTPKCLFTLHIGTVVLSDEAVINSREMSLMMTWQFYDQNATMTRMRAGRVVVFDFSTEYDVKITDHFLNYMKHETMQIVITELDKQTEPFASCALPLRDALLHTNCRADMSLALLAGPHLRHSHDAHDALDGSDEVGVLDLWCTLRVDPTLLPAINTAIVRASPSTLSAAVPYKTQSCMTELIEDVRFNDDHSSASIDIRPPAKQRTELLEFDTKRLPAKQRRDFNDLSRPVLPPERLRSALSQSPSHQSIRMQMVMDPGIRRSIASQISTLTDARMPVNMKRSGSIQRSQVGFKDADLQSVNSRIIANEVPANIKTAHDMKQALDRNAIHEHIPPISRLGKIEDDAASQTQSAASSWKGLVTRRQIPRALKRRSNCKKDWSVTSLLKKDRGNNTSSKTEKLRLTSLDIEEPPELTKSMRNQNGSKKSVTIAKYYENKENKVQSHDLSEEEMDHCIEITVMWLALNEECDAMMNPNVQRLYVAYSFLGQSGAQLETPVSLPKPKNYVDKCYFQFSKRFNLTEYDLPLLGHMAKCRSKDYKDHSTKNCIEFAVISEPPEDPLGLDACEDIGYAYLYLGDVLAYSGDKERYIEVVPVQSARRAAGESVCGVLAVGLDGLGELRRSKRLADSQRSLAH